MLNQFNDTTVLVFYFALADTNGRNAFVYQVLIAACVAFYSTWQAMPVIAIYLQRNIVRRQVEIDAVSADRMFLPISYFQVFKRTTHVLLNSCFTVARAAARTRAIFNVISPPSRYSKWFSAMLTRQIGGILRSLFLTCSNAARFRAMLEIVKGWRNDKCRAASLTYFRNTHLSRQTATLLRAVQLFISTAIFWWCKSFTALPASQDDFVVSRSVVTHFRAEASMRMAMCKRFVALLAHTIVCCLAYGFGMSVFTSLRAVFSTRLDSNKGASAICAGDSYLLGISAH